MVQTIEMSHATTRVLRIAGWSLAVLFIAFNVIASQFETGANWGKEDVVFAAVVFGVVGGVLELAARASTSLSYRIAAAVGVGAGLLLLWVNAAVGIVGMAICVAVAALGDPRALARGMRATAVFQGLVCLLHVIDGIYPAVLIDGFFTMTWLTAGARFARAAKERETAARVTQS